MPSCINLNELFTFNEVWKKDDLESNLTDQQRTTIELVSAMSSLVSFLAFEGEDSSMFSNARLPTLDCEIWVDENSGLLMHSFYEKKMCPNRVLQRSTALSQGSIRSSLCQEVVRRLKNCSLNLPQSFLF